MTSHAETPERGPMSLVDANAETRSVASAPIIPLESVPGVTNSGTGAAKRWRILGWPKACIVALGQGIRWLLGLATLLAGLAILAPIPILQFVTLGYFLEASGRVARSGRLREGFIGVSQAWKVGRIVLGAWLVLLPLRFASDLATDVWQIAPNTDLARNWSRFVAILTVLVALHIIGATFRGGKLRHYLIPRPIHTLRKLLRRGAYTEARDATWNFIQGMTLPHFIWLGLRGYIGALAWLVIPVSMIAAGRQAPLIGFLGGFALWIVLLYLPFLQTRFATENRLRAMFEVRAVRKLFAKAPIAFLFTLLITLLFATPLYLLKIELVPQEAAWLPSLVFIAFIAPARLLAGWSYGYATRRPAPRHWFFRHTARLAMIPIVGAYVLIVYFTQFTSWYGVASLYEQHAFLLPVPFLSF